MSVSSLPKGTAFTRYAIALMAGKGSLLHASEIARRFERDTPEVPRILSAAVDAGTTADAAWAAPLSGYLAMSGEFVAVLQPTTILGRLRTTRVPPLTRTPRQLATGSASWVGQGRPAPISAMAFDDVTLGLAKMLSIHVFAEEVVKFWSPGAEAFVRASMLRTLRTFGDAQFIDPAVTAVSDASPASITNGIVPTASTGATAAEAEADLAALAQSVVGAGNDMSGAAWVVNPRTALALSLMRDATTGARTFPDVTVLGGTLLGLPVLVSAGVPISAGTGATTIIVLIDASRVLVADDGLITLDATREASLQMDGDPQTGAQQLVSLWQYNLAALRAIRWLNYARADDSAVAVLDGVTY